MTIYLGMGDSVVESDVNVNIGRSLDRPFNSKERAFDAYFVDV